MDRKIIFVAMPTKGAALPDSVATGLLSENVYKALASLHTQHPECVFVAPMPQDYTILRYLKKSPVWEEWAENCKQLIGVSDEVWVLMFDGWLHESPIKDNVLNTSTGVAEEIAFATSIGKPVRYIDPFKLIYS